MKLLISAVLVICMLTSSFQYLNKLLCFQTSWILTRTWIKLFVNVVMAPARRIRSWHLTHHSTVTFCYAVCNIQNAERKRGRKWGKQYVIYVLFRTVFLIIRILLRLILRVEGRYEVEVVGVTTSDRYISTRNFSMRVLVSTRRV